MDTNKSSNKNIEISEPALLRLPIYLQMLKRRFNREGAFVSSSEIAEMLDLKPIQVRKDLEAAGANGKPKIGYNAIELIKSLEMFLGYDNISEAFLIGCGNLGSALLGYGGFKETGIKIVAAFDNNMNIVGTYIHNHKVFNMDKLEDLADRLKVKIAILTVPADKAQANADILFQSGIKAIWNFAPVHLKAPEGVIIQNENIAASLAVLAKKLSNITEME